MRITPVEWLSIHLLESLIFQEISRIGIVGYSKISIAL